VAAINGQLAVGDEEIRGVVLAGLEVGAQELHGVWCHRVGARERPFQAVDGNAPLLQGATAPFSYHGISSGIFLILRGPELI
jgi:hypothetical protein